MFVGHVTLRLLKPECDLDQAWEEEDLDTAAQRTIQLLHSHTVPQREAKSSGEQRKKINLKKRRKESQEIRDGGCSVAGRHARHIQR